MKLPPLSYSPQHAAFNLIVRAVGHHILQLLVLVDVSQWRHITLLAQALLAQHCSHLGQLSAPNPILGQILSCLPQG